jgi:hypothetical protein
MSNVAERCARGRWICAIDQEHASSDFGQCPGNGTADNAGANDGNVVCGRRSVPANDGAFVLAHLRLDHRGS